MPLQPSHNIQFSSILSNKETECFTMEEINNMIELNAMLQYLFVK